MTFSYNPNLADPISRVRQTLGDVDTATHDAEDETITYYLSAYPSELQVALVLCRDLMAKYAKLVDVTVDHQTTRASQAYQNYKNLAMQLEARLAATGGVPLGAFVGVMVTGQGVDLGPWDVPTYPNYSDYPVSA